MSCFWSHAYPKHFCIRECLKWEIQGGWQENTRHFQCNFFHFHAVLETLLSNKKVGAPSSRVGAPLPFGKSWICHWLVLLTPIRSDPHGARFPPSDKSARKFLSRVHRFAIGTRIIIKKGRKIERFSQLTKSQQRRTFSWWFLRAKHGLIEMNWYYICASWS